MRKFETHRGRQNHMDRSMLCRRALLNLISEEHGVSSPSVRRVIAPLHSVVSWTTEEKAKQAPTTVSGTQIRIRFVKKVRSLTYALIPRSHKRSDMTEQYIIYSDKLNFI